MSHAFPPPVARAAAASAIVLDAARCWRGARDMGHPVQPCLFVILRDHHCAMLAPVFDSLMTLCESALGRRLRVGEAASLSEDEHLLLGLLDGSKRTRACLDCGEGAATALDCAVCSTRIMLALVFDVGLAGADKGQTPMHRLY